MLASKIRGNIMEKVKRGFHYMENCYHFAYNLVSTTFDMNFEDDFLVNVYHLFFY